MTTSFSAMEVARFAGFKSTVMLNYLERSGTFTREYATLAHHGKKREYTFRDLVVLRAINRLLELGARPKRIEEAINTFARLEALPTDVDSFAAFAKKSSLFVVTHDQVIFCEPEQLINLSRSGQLAFSFMVDNNLALRPVVNTVLRYIDEIARQPRNRSTLNRMLKAGELN